MSSVATHEIRRSPKVGALAEGHPTHLAQLEQGQEAHDDLDTRAAALHQRAEGGRTLGLAHGDELRHRLGHGDRVHRDVGQVDPGHRALGRSPEVGLGQVLGRDPGQQVRGMHDEVVVEPHLPRDGARRLLGQGDEHVGRCGVGPALEQPGEEEVPLLPSDEILVVLAGLAARAAAAGT